MIEYQSPSDPDIFDCGADVLVNPVNTVGVMGAGLAKRFKITYPNYYEHYYVLCRSNMLRMGEPMPYLSIENFQSVWLVSFPTKKHWKDNSDIDYIIAGLLKLREMMEYINPHTLAIPALGCGLGGLNWDIVKLVIERTFADVEYTVLVFEPR